ncbi:uncharacterized protein PV06_06081 [Exophiala oligosperma]|uniref:Xylanolytic transcriptional activator regulatory domain-containing protein n=1 Tax=Exophiala oligosperma TaxID=215243 RepID=A0A0D2ARQ0_9EURO|nr:uncharacterized protein PV06_06081 [Exophiala oligosperma]KIW42541.1 hypothetical protein PV06_06081 [Exophiala oligosperma]
MSSLSRPERPCDHCRRVRQRCTPIPGDSCTLCQGRVCSYVEAPPKKRKKPSKPVTSGANTVSPLSPEANQRESPQDYSSLPGASLLKHTLGHQHFRTNCYVGATSFPSRVLLDLARDDQQHGNYRASQPGSDIRRVGENGYFLILPDKDDVIEEQLQLLDKIEATISPHGAALVDLYFRIVHPSFPILHKDVFLEKHSRSYRELTPACLAAVYMLALNWWSYSIDLAHLSKPVITELEKLVSSLMAFDRAAKVSDIQAGLLFLQRPRHDSWRLTTQLVATAEEVGLHRDCSDWQIPEWEKGVRKRLAWALFMQDKWGALVHGRPSHIKADNWEVSPLELADFPENVDEDHAEQGSSEVERGILIFMHMSSLTQIVSDIIDALFTVQAAMNYPTTVDLLQAVKPLQLRLKSWYTSLPSALDLGATQPRKLSATGQLYLAYLAAEVTLHRAIIESEMRHPLDAELRQITRGAAVMRFRSVIDFLKRLKPEHMQGFWHFASEPSLAIICTFSMVLLATSTETLESKDIFSQIAEFRWLLNINPSANFTRTTFDLLRTNAGFLAQYRHQRSAGVSNLHADRHASRSHEPEQAKGVLQPNEARERQGDIGEFSPQGLDVSPDQNWFYNFEDFELHS